jgi:hypothetical protein
MMSEITGAALSLPLFTSIWESDFGDLLPAAQPAQYGILRSNQTMISRFTSGDDELAHQHLDGVVHRQDPLPE